MIELYHLHLGSTVTIIGRGPSLLTLADTDVATGPVIVLNHAIERVRQWNLTNPLYTMQKDGCIAEPQDPEVLILSNKQSRECWPSYVPRYVVDPKHFGLHAHCMSVTLAVALADYMGCSGARLLAFDSFTHRDMRTVVGEGLVDTGRNYLYAAKQATTYADRAGLQLEWIA